LDDFCRRKSFIKKMSAFVLKSAEIFPASSMAFNDEGANSNNYHKIDLDDIVRHIAGTANSIVYCE